MTVSVSSIDTRNMKYRNHYCSPKYSDGDKCYYGNVEGLPQIPTIEAASIDDFEKLFHQAVDDYLDRKSGTHSSVHWGRIITLIVIIGLVIAAILTCPKKEQHVAAISDKVSSVLRDELSEDSDGFETLGVLLGSALAKPFIKESIYIKDYVLFSLGKYSYQGNENVVSVGVFGHVFTASKENMKQAVDELDF